LPNNQCDTIPQKFDCCDELRWNWAPAKMHAQNQESYHVRG
jgi:hypothetical protein